MGAISSLTGEHSDSKVASVFDSHQRAQDVARMARQQLGLQPSQVQVVSPQDANPGRKVEPESRGIFRTGLVAHLKLGLAGLAVGALAFALLYLLGVPAITRSPWMAGWSITGLGGFLGLMAGGLVMLRPDHTPMLAKVGSALEEGRHAVVVHAFDSGERDRAHAFLAGQGGETVRTL